MSEPWPPGFVSQLDTKPTETKKARAASKARAARASMGVVAWGLGVPVGKASWPKTQPKNPEK
jgi:hypothetical protein